MKMANTEIENKATMKQTFKSKLLSLNNGEFGMDFTYESHLAIDCFYEMLILCKGIATKTLYKHLTDITNKPELMQRAHKSIATLKTGIQQVRSIIQDETIQK